MESIGVYTTELVRMDSYWDTSCVTHFTLCLSVTYSFILFITRAPLEDFFSSDHDPFVLLFCWCFKYIEKYFEKASYIFVKMRAVWYQWWLARDQVTVIWIVLNSGEDYFIGEMSDYQGRTYYLQGSPYTVEKSIAEGKNWMIWNATKLWCSGRILY